MLITVCGLQGVGKTEVSKYILKRTGGLVLRTDVIRKELIVEPRYTSEEMQRIYEEMFGRAERALMATPVILDATFAKRSNREQARAIAEQAKRDFRLVEVVCLDDETVRKRLEPMVGDASDAKFAQYLQYKTFFEPIPIEEPHIIIDNSGSIESTRSQVIQYF